MFLDFFFFFDLCGHSALIVQKIKTFYTLIYLIKTYLETERQDHLYSETQEKRQFHHFEGVEEKLK